MTEKELLQMRAKLELKEGLNGSFYLKKLTRHPLTSIAQAQKLLNISLKNRQLANNFLNKTSSRSHTIFKLIFQFKF